MFKYNLYKLGLMVASALASIYIGFLAFEPAEANQIIRYGGYWLILTAAALLGWNLFQRGKVHAGAVWLRRRGWMAPAVYILVCSAIILKLQPDGYKIVMDEPALAATALQMHQEKEILTPARGYEISGFFYLLGGYVDKRPYLFAFCTSLLHDLTGYRPFQTVILNTLLTPVFLGLMFVVGRLLARQWGGYLAVSLIATVPLVAMNANSGGFDLLNLVMLLGTALAAYSFRFCPGPCVRNNRNTYRGDTRQHHEIRIVDQKKKQKDAEHHDEITVAIQHRIKKTSEGGHGVCIPRNGAVQHVKHP